MAVPLPWEDRSPPVCTENRLATAPPKLFYPRAGLPRGTPNSLSGKVRRP
jgi:hypothetical protein